MIYDIVALCDWHPCSRLSISQSGLWDSAWLSSMFIILKHPKNNDHVRAGSWGARDCGLRERERSIQTMTSHSHNEKQNLLRISKLALFHWYHCLGALVCNVSFKNSTHRKAMGSTNTARESISPHSF